MIRLARMAVFGGALAALAACNGSDDASTEAMPETVEVAADEALASVVEEPVADEEAAGPVVEDETAGTPSAEAE